MRPAALTVACCALVAGGARLGLTVLALAVLLVQVGLASTWHRFARVPGERSGVVVAVLAATAADVVLLLDDRGDRVGPVVVVAALVLPAAFVQQVVRSGGRGRLVSSVGATVTASALVLGASFAIPLGRTSDGRDVLLAACVAVAAATVVASLLEARLLGSVAGALVGGLAGFGVAAAVGIDAVDGVVLGVVTALFAVAGVRIRMLAGRTARSAVPTTATLPLVLAIPAAYVVARVLVG